MSNFDMLLAYEEEEDEGDTPALNHTPEAAVYHTYRGGYGGVAPTSCSN